MEFGVLIGLTEKLAQLIEFIKKSRVAKQANLAEYFQELGRTLGEMVEKLRHSDVPRIEGNRFKFLIGQFVSRAEPFLGTIQTHNVVSAVRIAMQQAQALDLHYLNRDELDEAKREQWLREMERATGQLQAIAILLRP
jgi:hypothetical protein